MKAFLQRTITLTLLFSLIIVAYTYVLHEEPLREFWTLLIEKTYVELPIIAWMLIVSAFLALSIALWTNTLERKRFKAIEQALSDVLHSEQPHLEMKDVPKRMQTSFQQIVDVLQTQKTSLKKIIDETVETEERLIQERVIEERQRLARELHDSVSQQLFAASMLLSAINEGNEHSPNRQPLQQVEQMVQQAQLEMRALLLHLRPVALNNKTIAEGLEDLLNELKEKVSFHIRFRLEDVALSKGAEDHLFRIAQETLSNTLRHAQATEVDVLFIERDGLAILRIQDDGVGFKQTDDKTGAYGLQNVYERAIEIGATCKIVSVPSQGTIVEVKLPVEKGDAIDDSDFISG